MGLPTLDELWCELRGAVTRHINLYLTTLAFDGLRGLAIAGVAGVLTGGVVLLISEMVSHLALQGAFDHCFGELLQQTIVAEHVFGRLVVLEQFV